MTGEPGKKIKLLALVGPTAAGKSALAIQVAQRLGGEIVTADSAQIYRYLDIGTAKPTQKERRLVPHHLVDLVEPDQYFSVADYQEAAYREIKKIASAGRLPLLVGGTGLYINAVIDRYAFLAGGKNERLRRRLRDEAKQKGLPHLYRRLEGVDPRAAAKIHPHDQRRIIRALEVYLQEGRPISEQEEATRRRKPIFDLVIYGLTLPRPQLYERIHRRLQSMLEAGFLEEVRQVLARGFPPRCRGLQSLGYRQLVQYLTGGSDKEWEATVDNIRRDTRRLAKRQLTWFRRDPRIRWLEYEEGEGPTVFAETISSRVKEILSL